MSLYPLSLSFYILLRRFSLLDSAGAERCYLLTVTALDDHRFRRLRSLSLAFRPQGVTAAHYHDVVERTRLVVTGKPRLTSLFLDFFVWLRRPDWQPPQHSKPWLLPGLRSLEIRVSHPYYIPSITAKNLTSLRVRADSDAVAELAES